VRISPNSVPPGFVSPGPVGVTVSVNSIDSSVTLEEQAHGSDESLSDGVIDFELTASGATLNGRLVDAQGSGVFGFLFVRLADGSRPGADQSPARQRSGQCAP
jgi:hypothetical protein